jgi:hypothetical protein
VADKKRINLDVLFKDAQLGIINKSISQTLTNLRTGHRRILAPTSKDNNGYVFLTRPQINLSYDNLIRYRPFMPLMNNSRASLASWIRATLDPRWARFGDEATLLNNPAVGATSPTERGPFSNQVDTKSPFINIVSNNIVQVSGFPDIQMPTFTSDPNRVGGVFQMIDGLENLYQPVDITLTIRDVVGDPVLNLFRVLSLYPARIYSKQMMRYNDFIIDDTIDYNIRLFRLIIGADGETVRHIGSTLPGFSQSIAIGHKFDYDIQLPYPEDQLVSLRLMFAGVEYDDPVLIDDFNRTVETTNMDMRDNKRTTQMMKIPREQLDLFSYERVYPHINIHKYRLEWWTDKATFARVSALSRDKLITRV